MPAIVTTEGSEEDGRHLGTLNSAITFFQTSFMARNVPEQLQH